jgi:hypothetical protein
VRDLLEAYDLLAVLQATHHVQPQPNGWILFALSVVPLPHMINEEDRQMGKRWAAWKEKNLREEKAFIKKVKIILPIFLLLGLGGLTFYIKYF